MGRGLGVKQRLIQDRLRYYRLLTPDLVKLILDYHEGGYKISEDHFLRRNWPRTEGGYFSDQPGFQKIYRLMKSLVKRRLAAEFLHIRPKVWAYVEKKENIPSRFAFVSSRPAHSWNPAYKLLTRFAKRWGMLIFRVGNKVHIVEIKTETIQEKIGDQIHSFKIPRIPSSLIIKVDDGIEFDIWKKKEISPRKLRKLLESKSS